MDMSLYESLVDPTRPVFLHGMTPPLESTAPGAALDIASKFIARSRVLVSDGVSVLTLSLSLSLSLGQPRAACAVRL